MRDNSDYFYLYFITFISISSLIISLVSNVETRQELKDFKAWIKSNFGGRKE